MSDQLSLLFEPAAVTLNGSFRVEPVACAGCGRSTYFDFAGSVRWIKFTIGVGRIVTGPFADWSKEGKIIGWACSIDCFLAYRTAQRPQAHAPNDDIF